MFEAFNTEYEGILLLLLLLYELFIRKNKQNWNRKTTATKIFILSNPMNNLPWKTSIEQCTVYSYTNPFSFSLFSSHH